MQRWVSKILVILLIVFISPIEMLFAQASSFRLQQADSLFRIKRYTQSLDHYQTIFNQQHYSPSMLLKMAYVEEGLSETGKALYHLNLYYSSTNDKTVLDKMEELAEKHNLNGYTQTDGSRLLTFYHDYHGAMGAALMVLSIFLLALSFYIKRKGRKPIIPLVLNGIVFLALLAHSNVGEKISLGIVSKNNTYLMDGPSPGATVISIIEAGHRLEIIGKTDVWVKIIWQGKQVYIKENNLLALSL